MSKGFTFFSEGQVHELQPPQWLIEGLLPKSSMCTLFGQPGAGKSFLALDFAMCISTGNNWLGRKVEAGQVVYCAQEGLTGMGQRIHAWRTARKVDATANIIFTRDFDTLAFYQPVANFIEAVKDTLKGTLPTLMVFDTLGLSALGADENDAKDMNQVMAHVNNIRKAMESTAVVLIHHTTKMGTTERGSTAIRGACDTMLKMAITGKHTTLSVDKQRDWAAGDPVRLALTPVGAGAVLCLDASPVVVEESAPKLNDKAQEALKTLKNLMGMTGADSIGLTEWAGSLGITKGAMGPRINALLDAGLIDKAEGHFGGYYPL
jgi:hypothetical protein